MQGEDKLRGDNWLQRVFYFYVDGFKAMTLGRTLWAIIAIKVIVFFVIVRFIFFPNYLNSKASTPEQKADYVRHELVGNKSAVSSRQRIANSEQKTASGEQQVGVFRDAVSDTITGH
ncbi:MAG: DUF4492 domain-containing protein [Muribaculaceae bacterium]|nr:DUF4492 domain-containing protein [Muribaculaceae bacterium]